MSKHLLILYGLTFSQLVFAQNWTSTKNIWEHIEGYELEVDKSLFNEQENVSFFYLDEKAFFDLVFNIPKQKLSAPSNRQVSKGGDVLVIASRFKPNTRARFASFSLPW